MFRLFCWFNKTRLTKVAAEFDDAVRSFDNAPDDDTDLVVQSLHSLIHLAGMRCLRYVEIGWYLFLQKEGVQKFWIGECAWFGGMFVIGAILHLLVRISVDGYLINPFLGFLIGAAFWGSLRILVDTWWATHLGRQFLLSEPLVGGRRKFIVLATYLREKELPSGLDFVTKRLMSESIEIDFIVEEFFLSPENPKLYFLRVGKEEKSLFRIVGAWIGDVEGEKKSLKVFKPTSEGV